MGMKDLSLTTLIVNVENDSLYHEIGNVTNSMVPNGGHYYARWIHVDGKW